MRKDREFYNLH